MMPYRVEKMSTGVHELPIDQDFINLMKATSTDNARVTLTYLNLDKARGVAVATDANILAYTHVNLDALPKSVMLKFPWFRLKRMQSATLCIYEADVAARMELEVWEIDKADQPVRKIVTYAVEVDSDSPYPDAISQIPEDEALYTVCINPQIVERLVECIGGGAAFRALTLEFGKTGLGPVRFESNEIRGLIMPTRKLEVKPGPNRHAIGNWVTEHDHERQKQEKGEKQVVPATDPAAGEEQVEDGKE